MFTFLESAPYTIDVRYGCMMHAPLAAVHADVIAVDFLHLGMPAMQYHAGVIYFVTTGARLSEITISHCSPPACDR